MKQHAAGFRTTHTGSLSRPLALSDLKDAGQANAAAGPHLKFGPGRAGIVEYSVRGRHVDARFVEVPGIEDAADFFALPEIEQSMESLGRTSA